MAPDSTPHPASPRPASRGQPAAPFVVGPFTLPVGYHRFHDDQLFNYQLNRPYSLGSARYEDLATAAPRISSFEDWKREMSTLGEGAEDEGRWLNAAAYYRAAEFYYVRRRPGQGRILRALQRELLPGDPRRAGPSAGRPLRRHLTAGPRTAGPPGTVLLHGGYDSFIEEFYPLLRFFADAGYRTIGFEGPGQGAVRRQGGLPIDYRWEQPVGAVLDRLDLQDVILIGLSMGGYFALRAAAFDRRIGGVIASGHAYDYLKVARAPAAWLLTFFHDHLRELSNRASRRQIRRGGMEAWNISHLMYIRDTDEPMAALDFAMELNEANLHCDRVTQDVLLLAARDDHFIPFRLHARQVRRLHAARSVTERVFTRADHAGNHCQIGNLPLALTVMLNWMDRVRRPGPAASRP